MKGGVRLSPSNCSIPLRKLQAYGVGFGWQIFGGGEVELLGRRDLEHVVRNLFLTAIKLEMLDAPAMKLYLGAVYPEKTSLGAPVVPFYPFWLLGSHIYIYILPTDKRVPLL